MSTNSTRTTHDLDPLNRDPITDAPGAHPVGTGIGAGVGGTIGAAVGSAAGPVGTVAGAAVGAVAGGLVGKGMAEAMNPTAEIEYWRTSYSTRPYYVAGERFEEYEPAYRSALDVYVRYPEWTWEQAEPTLRDEWPRRRGSSSLGWERAKEAVKDAWQRVSQQRHSAAAGPGTSPTKVATEANEVIESLYDSEAGFRAAADKVVNAAHRQQLLTFAGERERFITELKPLVTAAGESPTTRGSVAGSLQRGWMSLASALGAGDRAIVEACGRAEDTTLNAYRAALEDANLSPVARETLARQFQKVRDTQDQVRSWTAEARG